ncbi:MAG: 50S ribosomal protein L28 [Nitrospirota bacterium]
MAVACKLCGKSHQVGNKVSHAHNKSKRRFEPNLQSVRALIGNVVKRLRVCTTCIRSGKIIKPGASHSGTAHTA